MSLAGSVPTFAPMVSPKLRKVTLKLGQREKIKIRHTAADGKQGYPQTGGAQTPERHILRIEGDVSILESVVGGHYFRSTPLR